MNSPVHPSCRPRLIILSSYQGLLWNPALKQLELGTCHLPWQCHLSVPSSMATSLPELSMASNFLPLLVLFFMAFSTILEHCSPFFLDLTFVLLNKIPVCLYL